MKKALIIIFGFIAVIISLIVFRWFAIPDVIKSEIALKGSNRRYYSLEVDLAEFDEIRKIVLYNGFFSFDQTIEDKEKLESIHDLVTSGMSKNELDQGHLDLNNIKAFVYGKEDKLIGIATKNDNQWTLMIKDRLSYKDEKINRIFNEYE